jgi:hypothetical protein
MITKNNFFQNEAEIRRRVKLELLKIEEGQQIEVQNNIWESLGNVQYCSESFGCTEKLIQEEEGTSRTIIIISIIMFLVLAVFLAWIGCCCRRKRYSIIPQKNVNE